MDKMVDLTSEVDKDENPTSEQSFGAEMKSIWQRYSSLFIKGILNTLFIAIVSTTLGFLIGLLVAVIRKIQVNKIKILSVMSFIKSSTLS